jgi:large subunit ribosomal protein L6
MSRMGKKPLVIPSGVTVSVDGQQVIVKGPLGELSTRLPGHIRAAVEAGKVLLTRPDDERESKSCHGLARTGVMNMIEGVVKGYRKELEIQGVGFKAAVQKNVLSLSLGFSSPLEYAVPDGIKVAVEGGTALVISGADKQKVGDVAARVRRFFPAEPYKGKGIRFRGESVRRKVGKTVA